MDAAVDVRAGNDALIDSRLIRLEWLPKQSDAPGRQPRLDRADPAQPAAAMPSLDPEELATLIRRGQGYLRTGDIAAARLVLRRAANAGNPQAALALGATFDPLVLADLGVLGFPSDLTQARSWYDKAARLGSAEALRRIETLAHAGQ
jgi:TPR repeat protein